MAEAELKQVAITECRGGWAVMAKDGEPRVTKTLDEAILAATAVLDRKAVALSLLKRWTILAPWAVFSLTGGTFLNGYMLAKLWQWILVPGLHIAPISIPAAIGFSMIVRSLNIRTTDWKAPTTSKTPFKTIKDDVFQNLTKVGFMLGIGYILSHWIK